MDTVPPDCSRILFDRREGFFRRRGRAIMAPWSTLQQTNICANLDASVGKSRSYQASPEQSIVQMTLPRRMSLQVCLALTSNRLKSPNGVQVLEQRGRSRRMVVVCTF